MKKFTLILFLIPFTFLKAQNWMPVGSGLTGGGLRCMTEYNGELYVGGDFTGAGGLVAPHIAKWNGSSWSTVGTGLDNYVTGMAVYNGELYVVGHFHSAGGISLGSGNFSIAKWNGVNWDTLPHLIGITNYPAVTVFNNELIVSGDGLCNATYKWDGFSWSLLGLGTGSIEARGPGVSGTFCVYNNELYASGYFYDTTSSTGANYLGVGKWNGNKWVDITGAVIYPPQIMSMCVYNGELFASGEFLSSIGGITCNMLAKWNGSNWSSVSVNGSFSLDYLTTVYSTGGYLYLQSGYSGIHRDVLIFDGSNWSFASTSLQGANMLHGAGLFEYNSDIYAGASTSTSNWIARIHSLTGVDEIGSNRFFSISPNPFSSEAAITFTEEQKDTSIKIFDIVGKEIKTVSFSGKECIIEKGDMQSGIYFVQVTDTKRNVFTKKLLVE